MKEKPSLERLRRKLEMKYGARLRELLDVMENEEILYGYIRPETDIAHKMLIEKIANEERYYAESR